MANPMSNLIARSVLFVFACLFAFGSPAGADTILITSGGLRGTIRPNIGFTFGMFDAAGPDFSADPSAWSSETDAAMAIVPQVR